MFVMRNFIPFAILATMAQCVAAQGQMTTQKILQSSVAKVDQRYKDVDDAVVMFNRGNAQVAMSLLAKAAKEHPEIPPAEVMYAHLCFGSNKTEAGRAVLEIAVVRQEADPEPWIMLADLAMRAGRLAESDLLFQKGLEKTGYMTGSTRRQKSLQVNAHAGLARIDERRGLWEKAEAHLTRWMELEPDNTVAMQRLASACFSQKKFDQAKATLEKIREKNENQPLPEVVLGILHQKTGQQEESEKMMQEALKKGADDPVTRMAVAEWALTAGKIDMAKENAAEVLKLNADAVRADILNGRIKRFEGDDTGAESIFRKIYDKSPAAFVASNELALSLLAQDNVEKHKQALQYAQVNTGRYKDLRTGRGREAAATLAYGLHRVGQDAAAERVIQKVITSGEVAPQIGYFAAMIYKSRGRLDIAQQLLRKSLDSYIAFPEQESAQKLLDALNTESKNAAEPETKQSAKEAKDAGDSKTAKKTPAKKDSAPKPEATKK